MKFRRERQRGVLVEGLESRVLMSAAHAAAAASAVVFRSNPGSQTVGSVFGFTVAAVDSGGHVVTSDNATVTLTFAGPTGAMLNGTKKVALHDGVGTFKGLSVTGAGVYKLRVSQTSVITTKSPLVVGVAGLAITTQPTTAGWQSLGSLTIGDPVHQVTSNGTVAGIFLGNTNGSISIEMTASGTFNTTQVITDLASGATLTPMFLSAGSVGTIAANLTLLPVSAWTFSNGSFTVGDTVQQSNSNFTTGASGTWLGQLNGNYEIEVSSGRFTSPGNITDNNSSAVLSTSASNVTSVSSVAISQLSTLESFSGGTAGVRVNVVASVLGANGMVKAGDRSKISLVVAAGSGAGSTLATVTAVNGVANFRNIALTKAGVFSLKVVSGKQSSVASNAISINPGVPVKLKVVSTFPPNTAAVQPTGSLGPIVVQILDSFGNVVTAPSELTLPSSTVRGWSATGTLSVNDNLLQTQTSTGTTTTTTTAAGVFLGLDSSGDFLIRTTSGAFNNTNVINDTTSGAMLTPNNAAAFPSNNSTVTAVVNSTLMTTTTTKVAEAANGTATSVNGTANITLTSTAGGTGTTLGLTPGYYTLIVSDGALTGETFQIHVN